MLEGSAGSTTNGGAEVYSGAGNRLGICCGTTLTTEKISVFRDSVSKALEQLIQQDNLHFMIKVVILFNFILQIVQLE